MGIQDSNIVGLNCANCDLRHESMFGLLCNHESQKLSIHKDCTLYEKGQQLFHEGSHPMGVYCINKGKVKVGKLGTDGKEQIIYIAKEGDLLGFRSLLAGEKYGVSAETVEDSNVCFIPKQDFLETMFTNLDLQSKILKKVCQELQTNVESFISMSQSTVRERTARMLLMLRDTYGADTHDDGSVEINLSREDLANIVGTATESLIRQLHDLKDEGLIQISGRKIKVINALGLIDLVRSY